VTEDQGRLVTAGRSDLVCAIRAAGREQGFARGEQIQSAATSDSEASILLIETGFVSTVAIAASHGKRTLVSIHGPGDLAGEDVLFGSPSEAYRLAMTAMTNGTAWRVGQDGFRQILDDHPQGWEILARHAHDRAAAAEERICLMAGEAAGRRLAVFLLELLSYGVRAQASGNRVQRIPLPLSRTDLAEWIGVSRETVERVLGVWVQRGIVRTGRRDLIVRDIPGLEKIAGGLHQPAARARSLLGGARLEGQS
jgi:CRP/FNR family transcriptional regulator, anaerobic regulatory protein